MSDLDSFLNAIEADLGDDALWLVFADWLEEQGDPASGPIREAVEQEDWDGCRDFLFLSLDRPRRLLAECDCVERVLPLFEAQHPHDPSPRRLLETLRRKGPDARVKGLRAIVARSCQFAYEARWIDDTTMAAREAARAVRELATAPRGACRSATYASVVGACGSDYQSRLYRIRPERVAAQILETRWQVSRILRYRFDQGGEGS